MARLALILAAALMFAAPAGAADVRDPAVYADAEGRAIGGYDPVAYHLERRPVAGEPGITHDWNGATWHFASEENRDRFAADPERWAPEYGGYCAYAVATGSIAPVDPTIFRIFDGKLYLNLNMHVHRMWLQNRDAYIENADRMWPDVLVRAE